MSAPLALGDKRLVVITGKGGVGKTTVAAALARAAASTGRRVLAVDVDDAGVARALGCTEPAPEPVSIEPGLAVVRIDRRTALGNAVRSMLPLGMLADRLLASTTFQLVAAAAPGLSEYVTLAAIGGWLDATRLRRPRWNLLVVDAPASGHSLLLLSAPNTLGAIAQMAPAGLSLGSLGVRMRDRAHTAVWLVTRAEELAVREAAELHEDLTSRAHLPVAAPIVNAVPRRRFTRAELEDLAGEPDDHPMIAAARFIGEQRRYAMEQLRAFEKDIGRGTVRLPLERRGDDEVLVGGLLDAVASAAGLT